jgi:hypothetical protein
MYVPLSLLLCSPLLRTDMLTPRDCAACVPQLVSFEAKVQRLAERQQDKEEELVVDPVLNVMGSTAGAGSG